MKYRKSENKVFFKILFFNLLIDCEKIIKSYPREKIFKMNINILPNNIIL